MYIVQKQVKSRLSTDYWSTDQPNFSGDCKLHICIR